MLAVFLIKEFDKFMFACSQLSILTPSESARG